MKTLLVTVFLFLSTSLYADDSSNLDLAVSGNHRSDANVARDVYRHPKETLQLFKMEPTMQVLEILPGRGWYTEILAPYLATEGHLTVASFGENHPTKYLANVHKDFVKL